MKKPGTECRAWDGDKKVRAGRSAHTWEIILPQ